MKVGVGGERVGKKTSRRIGREIREVGGRQSDNVGEVPKKEERQQVVG